MQGEDPLNLTGQVLKDRYRVQHYLGGGGFGHVYCAYDHTLKVHAALKIPRDSGLNASILKEANGLFRLRRLAHKDRVVCFHAVEELNGCQVLVMEYCEGGSLRNMLARGPARQAPLPAICACRVVRQICQALSHAHDLGYVHRDVKPDNIFFAEDGGSVESAKLGDFGIAAILESSRAPTRVGTRFYMAPEVHTGIGSDARSDIYSMGVTLYETLTGTVPFDLKQSEFLVLKAVVEGKRRPLRDSSRAELRFEPILERAMHIDPGGRYPSADVLERDIYSLEAVLATEAESAALYHRDFRTARASLRGLCERYPDVASTWIEHARYLKERGHGAEAVSTLETSLRHVPDSPVLLHTLAQHYAGEGRYLQAVACMERALQADRHTEKEGFEAGLEDRDRHLAPLLSEGWLRSAQRKRTK